MEKSIPLGLAHSPAAANEIPGADKRDPIPRPRLGEGRNRTVAKAQQALQGGADQAPGSRMRNGLPAVASSAVADKAVPFFRSKRMEGSNRLAESTIAPIGPMFIGGAAGRVRLLGKENGISEQGESVCKLHGTPILNERSLLSQERIGTTLTLQLLDPSPENELRLALVFYLLVFFVHVPPHATE